jgi:hypothetical protein
MKLNLNRISRFVYGIFIIQATLFAHSYVFQQGDTLKFFEDDKFVKQWVITDSTDNPGSDDIVHIRKAQVSADSNYFFIYEEEYFRSIDSVCTKITMYNAAEKKLLEKKVFNKKRIAFHLTSLYKDIMILAITNKDFTDPRLDIIYPNGEKTLIKENEWHRLISYALSPNLQFLICHAKGYYKQKLWDYMYFMEIATQSNWTYIFPICASCKRDKITVTVNNDGESEVIYKGQHRVFSKQGQLIDFYIK